jgi:translation initiation factor 1
MRQEKKKIELNPQQPGLAGMSAAFANLSLSLPETPEKAVKSGDELNSGPQKTGRVLLRKETAHRGGKIVIIVYDFPPHWSDAKLEALGREMRQAVGCGGTVRDRQIEMQGDQAKKIRSFLEKNGWKVGGI